MNGGAELHLLVLDTLHGYRERLDAAERTNEQFRYALRDEGGHYS